jgi:hypothetical protein
LPEGVAAYVRGGLRKIWHDSVGRFVLAVSRNKDGRIQFSHSIRYIRVSTVATKRRRGWTAIDTTYKKHMPSGRLAIRAYCPYGGVDWEKRWCEKTTGEISQQLKTIVKGLEAEVPTIVSLREQAQKQADIEHQRWEAQWREYEKRQEERRRADARRTERRDLRSHRTSAGDAGWNRHPHSLSKVKSPSER